MEEIASSRLRRLRKKAQEMKEESLFKKAIAGREKSGQERKRGRKKDGITAMGGDAGKKKDTTKKL